MSSQFVLPFITRDVHLTSNISSRLVNSFFSIFKFLTIPAMKTALIEKSYKGCLLTLLLTCTFWSHCMIYVQPGGWFLKRVWGLNFDLKHKSKVWIIMSNNTLFPRTDFWEYQFSEDIRAWFNVVNGSIGIIGNALVLFTLAPRRAAPLTSTTIWLLSLAFADFLVSAIGLWARVIPFALVSWDIASKHQWVSMLLMSHYSRD